MYTEQDYADIRRQWRRRIFTLSVPAAVMLAGIVLSFVFRVRWLTIGLTILLGFFCVFSYGLLVEPVAAYARHLDNVLHQRVRSVTGVFKSMGDRPVFRDGVEYYPVMVNVGEKDLEEDDRLFYFDANLPRPDWQRGETITLTAHDKALSDWTRV